MEELEFAESDFDGMLYPTHKVHSNRAILKIIPEFDRYREFRVPLDRMSRTKIIKYIAYCYDRKSPIVQNVDNLFKRKVYSAQLAQFIYDNNGKFDPTVVKMMKGENPKINEMIIRYCRLQGPRIYSLIVAGNETYYDIVAQLHQRRKDNTGHIIEDGVAKGKLFDKADEIIKKLDDLVEELLVKDKNKELENNLFLAVDLEEEANKLTPENVSDNLI